MQSKVTGIQPEEFITDHIKYRDYAVVNWKHALTSKHLHTKKKNQLTPPYSITARFLSTIN